MTTHHSSTIENMDANLKSGNDFNIGSQVEIQAKDGPSSSLIVNDGFSDNNSVIEKESLSEDKITDQIATKKLCETKKRKHMEDIAQISNKKSQNSEDGKTVIEVPLEGNEEDATTCQVCKKVFANYSKKRKHLANVHKFKFYKKTFIKCIECNIEFIFIDKLRQHLKLEHGMNMTKEVHHFPNMEAFKLWKQDIEKKGKVFYTKDSSRIYPNWKITGRYSCNRSGIHQTKVLESKRQRMARYEGSVKMGFHCTSIMNIEQFPNKVIVVYWPNHYGHVVTSEQLASKDQSTLQDSISSDVLFSDLLLDVRENVSGEKQLHMASRKRDLKILKAAFGAEEYNPGLTDSESVDHWVRLCAQMEDSPVLNYKQEELPDGKEDFFLVIMTEFQRQLLESCDKKVICMDGVHRRQGLRFYLTCISIVDDCDIAFPVAFCISDKVNKSVITQFLLSIKASTGPLSCTYFMSDNISFYFEAWKEVMDDSSKWLWCMWFIDYNVQRLMKNCFNKRPTKKAEVYKTARTLIECQNQSIFEMLFENFLESLQNDESEAVKRFGSALSKRYASNTKLWAYCYRTDMKPTINFQLDALHRTLRYCSKEGRKTRLDKFIFVLMKFLKMKMLDRLGNILDDQKIEMAKEAINICHNQGMYLSPECISSLSDKIWLVKAEDENVYVTRDFDSCPDHCQLQCAECDICVHMYSCSCIISMIHANLCQHIHAVVWKFLTPHFSPAASPERVDISDDSVEELPVLNKSSLHANNAMKMTHTIYKSIRDNKLRFTQESLATLMKKLNEVKDCIDVVAGKKTGLNARESMGNTTGSYTEQTFSIQSVSSEYNTKPLTLRALRPKVPTNSSLQQPSDQTKSPSERFLIFVPLEK